MKYSAILLVCALVSTQGSHGKRGFTCKDGVHKSICLPENYSKFELPFTEKTNQIAISIDIDDVLRINDGTYSITFSTYFNVHWNERRLNVQPDFGSSLRTPNSTDAVMVPMNLEFIKELWVPNIFIYNLKTYKVIDVLSKLAGLWIDTEKNVLYSQATHITFICPMRFDKFPLDTQKCRFSVGSYSYDSSKMLFTTKAYGYSSKETNSIALDYDISELSCLSPFISSVVFRLLLLLYQSSLYNGETYRQ